MPYLFHKDVFLPASVASPCFEGKLRYTDHAIRASKHDRFGGMQLPETFTAANAVLIEAELADDRSTVLKQVWRLSLDEDRDLVLAITSQGKVKTVWINMKHDRHQTLRGARYMRP